MTAAERPAKSSGLVAVAVVERPAAALEATAAAPQGTSAWPAALPKAAEPAALARLRAAAAQLVPHAEYRIVRLGAVGQAGLAALAAAAVIAVSALIPAQHALQTVTRDLARARHAPVAEGTVDSAPRLLAMLPTRAEVPAVIGQMFTEAKAAGVSLDTGHYVYTAAKGGGTIARYDLEFPVKASYPDIRRFIDRTLTAVPAAALGKLRFERKVVGDAIVAGDIGFVLFVRAEDPP
jgi:hypothetical protein